MSAARSEGELWSRARRGDGDSFAVATGRYRRELEVHAYRMLGSAEDAEDIVQETFLRAWRKRETFRGQATLRAWLYGIATNASLDLLERRSRRLLPRIRRTRRLLRGRRLSSPSWLRFSNCRPGSGRC